LTLAFIINGRTPGTLWLLLIVGVNVAMKDIYPIVKYTADRKGTRIAMSLLWSVVWPVVLILISPLVMGTDIPLIISVLYSLAVVIPLGPMLYKLIYQPLAEASVLVLVITSVALHFALTGLGLVFFGAEGWRTPAFMRGQVDVFGMMWSAQTLFVLASCAILIGALWIFFGAT